MAGLTGLTHPAYRCGRKARPSGRRGFASPSAGRLGHQAGGIEKSPAVRVGLKFASMSRLAGLTPIARHLGEEQALGADRQTHHSTRQTHHRLHSAWETTEKAPPRERGSSGVHRFSRSSKARRRAEPAVTGKMTRALALAGPLTKRRVEPLVSVSEGRQHGLILCEAAAWAAALGP